MNLAELIVDQGWAIIFNVRPHWGFWSDSQAAHELT